MHKNPLFVGKSARGRGRGFGRGERCAISFELLKNSLQRMKVLRLLEIHQITRMKNIVMEVRIPLPIREEISLIEL